MNAAGVIQPKYDYKVIGFNCRRCGQSVKIETDVKTRVLDVCESCATTGVTHRRGIGEEAR